MTLSRSKLCQRWRNFSYLTGPPHPRPLKSLCYPGDLYFFLGFRTALLEESSCCGGSLVTSIFFFIRSGWFFPWRLGIFEELCVFWCNICKGDIYKDPKLHIWHIQSDFPPKKKCQNIFSKYTWHQAHRLSHTYMLQDSWLSPLRRILLTPLSVPTGSG